MVANRMGIAARRRRGETSALVLLSRRMVSLEPTPSRVAPGAEITLRGTVLETGAGGSPASSPQPPASAQLAVSFPTGQVRQHPLPLHDGRFEERLAVGPAAGVLNVQLLVSRGLGPRIAAMFPVGVGRRPPWPRSPARIPDIPVPPTGEEEAEDELAALLLGVRQARGLSLPLPSRALADVARLHARDMAARGFFGHIAPPGRADVAQRLSQHRVRYVRALENIAAAASVQDVFAQWMASPAHRANLVDPRITAAGVGVSLHRDNRGTPVVAVLVMAELADQGSASHLVQRARDHINARRRGLGLPALRTDPVLDGLASHHSQAMAEQGELVYETADLGSLVQAAFRANDATSAAADIYLADTTTIVERSAHVEGDFQRAGVGIYRQGSRSGPQLWITVIYAAD
jgi:uncharacterized protein YkwD